MTLEYKVNPKRRTLPPFRVNIYPCYVSPHKGGAFYCMLPKMMAKLLVNILIAIARRMTEKNFFMM